MLKLNLGCGQDVRVQEYINVDLDARELPSEFYRQGDAISLDWLCPDGEADEILALNLLPFIRLELMDKAIEEWCKKLRVGGTMKFSAPCLWRICKDFANERLDLTGVLNRLYGTQGNDQWIKSGVDLRTMCDRLESLGMQIVTKRYNDEHTFYIEAVKQA